MRRRKVKKRLWNLYYRFHILVENPLKSDVNHILCNDNSTKDFKFAIDTHKIFTSHFGHTHFI